MLEDLGVGGTSGTTEGEHCEYEGASGWQVNYEEKEGALVDSHAGKQA